jgi:Hemerythrin HHE cation binding domain
MDTTAVLSSPPTSDHPPDPTGDSPLRLVDPNSVDAANVLVEVHARVGRTFASYEAAEGSHARQYQALGAISTALATHVAVEDELVFPAVGAQTGRHDAELRRQRQQDHLLDLLLVELGGMVPSDLYFDAKVQVLMQVFGQHVRDCEAVVVPELLRRLDASERERLGRRVRERIQQLEGRPRPGW